MWPLPLEINVPSGITMEKAITTATELFIRVSCWFLIIKRSISGLTNIAAATTTLQHTRCTQTDNYFTTTAYCCQGQRQPEDRQGAVWRSNAATARLLTLVKPAETLARDWPNTNERREMVTSTITLLNTIYRRNIKSTGTLRHVVRILQTTINDSLKKGSLLT